MSDILAALIGLAVVLGCWSCIYYDARKRRKK